MRDLGFFLVYDEGEAELLPDDPVTVVAEFGDLSDGELQTWEPVLVGGCLRIGVAFLPYEGSDLTAPNWSTGERIGPMYVVDKTYPSASGASQAGPRRAGCPSNRRFGAS